VGRAHVEFVQSQRLRWQDALPAGVRDGAAARILSADRDSGACSLVLRYPPHWRQPGEQRLVADEELFVLDGELAIGAQRYTTHDYAYLPAGFARRGLAAGARGAIVLTFFGARPAVDATLRDPEPLATGLVERLDVYAMPWIYADAHAQMRPGCGRKTLRQDPRTGDTTWLLTSPPHGTPPGGAGQRETHPTVEEVFVLIGDLHGNCGVMRPGAYFWRPPGIVHGPYGTRLGATSLYRTVGGPLVAEWTADRTPFHFDPPYTPFLPPDLALLPEPATLDAKPY